MRRAQVMCSLLLGVALFATACGRDGDDDADGGSGTSACDQPVWVLDSSDDTLRRFAADGSAGSTTELGATGNAVAAASSQAWVTLANGTVLSVACDDSSQAPTFDVGGSPGLVAVNGTDTWITDTESGEVVDVAPDDQTERVSVSTGGFGGLAVTDDGVYALAETDLELFRIDPTTRSVAASTELGSGTADGALAVGGGSVWVLDLDAGELVELDLESLDEQGRTPLGDGAADLVYAGDEVWILEGSQLVARSASDPSQSEDAGSFESPTALAAGEGSVWVIDQSGASVVEVDVDSRSKGTTIDGVTAAAIAVG